MARIRPVQTDTTAGETAGARIQHAVSSITGHRPEIAAGIGQATQASRTSGTLSPRLRELIRLRIAFHNQCRSCMAMRYSDAVDDGLDDDLVCSLEQPQEAGDLTPAERSALRFADLFATNHLAIDDAVYDDLRQHFTEGELVEIGLNCAICVGMGRLAATWKVTEDLPEYYQHDDAVLAPWVGEGVLVPSMGGDAESR